MAKFAKWNNWFEMARDLKRGLYQLTFKDNMPNEPVVYEWRPDIRSAPGTSFTINSSLGNVPTYSIIGNRCFFKISSLHVKISGNAQSVFWLRLPVPAKSLTEGRWMGFMFCPYPRAIFFNALVSPNEWWLRLEAHSEVASIGSFPVTEDTSLVVSGDFEIHPAYLRTGAFQERDVPFESYSTSAWTSSGVTPTSDGTVAGTVTRSHFVLHDLCFIRLTGIVAITAPATYLTFSLPYSAGTLSQEATYFSATSGFVTSLLSTGPGKINALQSSVTFAPATGSLSVANHYFYSNFFYALNI